MIGKSQWFNRRKYSGWGLTPKTWQGWAYIGLWIIVVTLVQNFVTEANWRLGITIFLVLFLLIDFLQIMADIKLDEREAKIEALAERNASWSMVAALALGIFYLSLNQINCLSTTMPVLGSVLAVGLIAKAGTNIYFKNKEL